MQNVLDLTLDSRAGSQPLRFDVKKLWNGGYAGRNTAAVQKHVDELAEHGVPAPKTVPIYFPLSNNQITTTEAVQVLGPESSGEVEYVLLFTQDGILVGLASDHSDRAIERTSIQASKQMYPDVVASQVWPLDEVRQHWDEIELRSWSTLGETRRLYQEVKLAELMDPGQWLKILERERIAQPGTAFLSGTPGTLSGMEFGERFEVELHDPVLGRTLRHGYAVEVLPHGVQ
jgi:hypothetical protein